MHRAAIRRTPSRSRPCTCETPDSVRCLDHFDHGSRSPTNRDLCRSETNSGKSLFCADPVPTRSPSLCVEAVSIQVSSVACNILASFQRHPDIHFGQLVQHADHKLGTWSHLLSILMPFFLPSIYGQLESPYRDV